MLPFPCSGVGYHLMISTLDSETLLYPNGGLLGEIRACGAALAQLQGYIHMLHRHITCRYSSGHLIPIIQSYQDELGIKCPLEYLQVYR